MSSSKRDKLLNKELSNYHPKRYRINRPGIDYTIRLEDFIPALSGSIGKIALVAAFAMSWATGYGIDSAGFVVENVRLELFLGCLLCLIFTAFMNPYAAPPGTLAPLIPLIPLMASSKVHPLILGLMIGILGLIIYHFKLIDVIIKLNGIGARGGIIFLFGVMGAISSFNNLSTWAKEYNSSIFGILIMIGIVAYLLLSKINYKWLIIPLVAVVGILVSALYGIFPELKTLPAFPIINPKFWWFDMWGLGWGFHIGNVIKALPFALLAIVMWPTDAIAIKTLQETKYGEDGKNSVVELNSTFLSVSIRNILGSLFGGAQTAAIWRSFMIPLAIIKRPIGGSAFILGILGITFSLLGAPLDIAVFPPIIWLVLLFGVYLPLIEVGFHTLKTPANIQIGILSFVAGFAINPVIGWVVAILVENCGIISDSDQKEKLSSSKVKLTLIVSLIVVVTYMLSYIV